MGYKYSKEAILEVGYQVLRKNGYHHVGINQILQESGIPKGSFYNFFKSKEDFAYQVIRHYGLNNADWIREFFAATELSPIHALEDFYHTLINMNEADEYAGGCLVNNMSVEIGRTLETLADESDARFREWLTILEGVVAKGQRTGEITGEFSAADLAEYLHAGFYGALSRCKVTKSRLFADKWLHTTLTFLGS